MDIDKSNELTVKFFLERIRKILDKEHENESVKLIAINEVVTDYFKTINFAVIANDVCLDKYKVMLEDLNLIKK